MSPSLEGLMVDEIVTLGRPDRLAIIHGGAGHVVPRAWRGWQARPAGPGVRGQVRGRAGTAA